MSQDLGPTVTVKRDILKYFNDSLKQIVKSHSVHLRECDNVCDENEIPSDSVVFRVSQHSLDNNKQCLLSEAASYIQKYADSLANGGASGTLATEPSEDSSYDSDFETDDATSASHADISRASSCATGFAHRDVARTVSDTLAAEFAEYVNVGSSNGASASPDRDAGYTQRVEFALKLGYTERLVRAALAKLGPNPEQNELLAELIRLGAQCPRQADSPPEEESRSPDSTSSRDVGSVMGSDSLLRHIVIDGSNVAMSHGNKEVFSCRGIKICVDWFRARGHQEITVFVPKWRKEAGKPDSPIADREILEELERERLLVFTPSRLVGGKRLICYDDRYVLRLASETDGIVVSNDNYRDLAQENPDFRRVIEERLLMYSFVNDRFMPPDDPLGRTGPDLERFLRCRPRTDPPPPCPYARKCTYGNKCKFDHPERGSRPHKSVTERLSEGAARALRARARDLHAVSLPLPAGPTEVQPRKTPLARTASATPSSVRGLQPIGPPAFDPMVAAHFERAQLQNMQPHLHHSLHPQLQQHQHKSHSVENVTRLPPPEVAYCWRPTTPERSAWNYSSPSTQGPVCEPAEGVNPHRKLQRQLTLNPLCEPQQWRTLTPPEHAAAARVASAPGAPGAPCPPGVPPVAPPSISEPALHLWEARRRMHYHLASIFPDDQVCQAMTMYPEETDAQKICAVILSLFHKH